MSIAASPKEVIPSGDSKSAIGSLQKGLKLVELALNATAPLSLSELAALSKFDTSSTHRLLQVLLDQGYMVREEHSKRYMAGPRALSPLSILHPLNELRRSARQVLESLRDTSGQTTSLIVFVGNQRLTLDVSRGAQQLVPYYDTWLDSPLHASATGKAFLAWGGVAQMAELLGPEPYKAYTASTAKTLEELEAALAESRSRGYTIGRDEPYLGITSLAAPIYFMESVVGCLAVTARTDVITHDYEKEIAFALRTGASLISHSGLDVRSVFYLFNSPVG